VRPGSSSVLEKVSRAATPAGVESLPQLPLPGGKRKKSERVSATEYKQLMDQIRAVKQDRQTMLDPFMANLKVGDAHRYFAVGLSRLTLLCVRCARCPHSSLVSGIAFTTPHAVWRTMMRRAR